MSFLKNKHYNKASLILVTYNNYKLLVKALESIYTYTPHNLFHLYIIDNNSTDKTASLHAKKLVNTTLIKNNKNLYWAGGINQGILLSQDKYKYIFFLNDDIEVYSNWLQNHISVLDKYPDVGVVGPLDSSINSLCCLLFSHFLYRCNPKMLAPLTNRFRWNILSANHIH